MPTLRDSLIASEEANPAPQTTASDEAMRRIAALERDIAKLRRDVTLARYAGLIGAAIAVGLLLRSFVQM